MGTHSSMKDAPPQATNAHREPALIRTQATIRSPALTRLRCDPGVVRPWQPQHGAPPEPVVPRQDVLKGDKHGVAHVQLPRHVGGGHSHGEGRLARGVGSGCKVAGALPPGQCDGVGLSCGRRATSGVQTPQTHQTHTLALSRCAWQARPNHLGLLQTRVPRPTAHTTHRSSPHWPQGRKILAAPPWSASLVQATGVELAGGGSLASCAAWGIQSQEPEVSRQEQPPAHSHGGLVKGPDARTTSHQYWTAGRRQQHGHLELWLPGHRSCAQQRCRSCDRRNACSVRQARVYRTAGVEIPHGDQRTGAGICCADEAGGSCSPEPRASSPVPLGSAPRHEMGIW